EEAHGPCTDMTGLRDSDNNHIRARAIPWNGGRLETLADPRAATSELNAKSPHRPRAGADRGRRVGAAAQRRTTGTAAAMPSRRLRRQVGQLGGVDVVRARGEAAVMEERQNESNEP